MKYIKTFEKLVFPRLYKRGDYVLLDINKIEGDNVNNFNLDPSDLPESDIAKITNFKYKHYEYVVAFYSGKKFNISEDEIIRKLTDEEVKKYLARNLGKRYNMYFNENASGKFVNVDYKIIKKNSKGDPELLITDFKIINHEDNKLTIKAKGYTYSNVEGKKCWTEFDDFKNDKKTTVWNKNFENGTKRIKVY